MKFSSTVCIFFFIMALTIWSSGEIPIAEALTPAECKAERTILVNACKSVVTRRPPSPFCCQRLRLTHIQCVCSVITPKLAALVDVKYAIKVIQSCGRQVPRHFKCGSITTP
ncbi:hypothetical protein K7X08_025766 [Anisodus acutangulus]|uniref:Bifunctional inhibitor/plant lipid transfer protein/seed storage helical domain-containing protein n=1 Tax=Anisodus acutangulus TaxID=402998 RepID=A0A9Q1L9B0_9SOLA|nr:hypothetical protein K7X08_025766 [Anisodus acutangulus]